MSQNSTQELLIRPATIQDWKMLFDWRNDVQTRAASRSTDPIDELSHREWLGASLTNPKRRLLIAELDSQPVGTVRFDLCSPCEVSWTVAPAARGQGIGARMVRQAVRGIDFPIIAVARTTNRTSIRIAEAAGFTLIHNDGGWVTLQREPNKPSKADD